MNRYALGGALGVLLLLVLSGAGGLGRLLPDGGQTRGNPQAEDSTLGTLPIEQAGQVVQRQGSPAGVPAAGTGTMAPMGGDFSPTGNGFTTPGGTPPTLTPTQPGSPSNVIPRQDATTLPAPIGDIAPVQPDLVQPDPPPPATTDPELESIPALW